jgi:hypothetical protein
MRGSKKEKGIERRKKRKKENKPEMVSWSWVRVALLCLSSLFLLCFVTDVC